MTPKIAQAIKHWRRLDAAARASLAARNPLAKCLHDGLDGIDAKEFIPVTGSGNPIRMMFYPIAISRNGTQLMTFDFHEAGRLADEITGPSATSKPSGTQS